MRSVLLPSAEAGVGLSGKVTAGVALAMAVTLAVAVAWRGGAAGGGSDLVAVGVMLAGWGITLAVVAHVVVVRPLQALTVRTLHLGRGDTSPRAPTPGTDELAALTRAIDDLGTQLQAAHAERDAAASTRVAAVERLRHVDRLSTMGTLAAGIAHELGTPLHVVGGRAQLILDAPSASEGCKKAALVIVEEADRMAGIVRQLLDFARKRPLEKVSIDARALSARVIDLLSMLARKSGVSLQLGPASPGNVQVVADGGQLEQAVTNLVVNAVQASRFGQTVQIDVRRVDAVTPPPEVGGPARDEVWVSVSDEGPGITEQNLEKLFTPFFTTKDVGAGTGLGLAIAWGLVREHDGAIVVDTRVGAGSTFTIRLPAGAAATPSST